MLSPDRVSQGPWHPSGPAFSDGGHSAHWPRYSAHLEAPHHHPWSEGVCEIWGRASQSKMGHGERLGWVGLGVSLSRWFGALSGRSRCLQCPGAASSFAVSLWSGNWEMVYLSRCPYTPGSHLILSLPPVTRGHVSEHWLRTDWAWLCSEHCEEMKRKQSPIEGDKINLRILHEEYIY